MRELTFGISAVLLQWTAVAGVAAQVPEVPTPIQTQPIALPSYNILRYNEDWSALRDTSRRTTPLDRIKFVPLGHGKERYLSIGGEFRGVFERIQNDNWGGTPYPTNSFGLERFQLHLDAHFDPKLRLFLQLESGLEQGRQGGPRPIDEKHLDFLNAFIDLRPSNQSAAPTIRIGRQELNYGSGRLVAVREGPNVRQGFYGFRVDERVQKWTLSSFAVRPAVDNSGYFDNVPLHSTAFWGSFGSRSWTRSEGYEVDGYYFGLDKKSAAFNQGTAQEVRQTFGVRMAAEPPADTGNRKAVPHFDVEAVDQFGSFGTKEIRAWTIATEVGVVLARVPLRPRIGARADVASGDGDPEGRTLGTFNALFPIGNYFGVLADTGPGPVNFRDLHPQVRLTLPHGVSANADWVIWWRQSLQDGVYGVPGNLLVPAGKSDARFVGDRPGLEARWQIDRHLYIQSDYGVFFAGPFLRQSGNRHNLNYTSVWLGYKF